MWTDHLSDRMFSFPIISRATLSEDFLLDDWEVPRPTGYRYIIFFSICIQSVRADTYGSLAKSQQQVGCWSLRAPGGDKLAWPPCLGGLRWSPEDSGCWAPRPPCIACFFSLRRAPSLCCAPGLSPDMGHLLLGSIGVV